MKKLVLSLALVVALTSCESHKNVTIVDESTKLPNKVVMAIKDSTLTFNTATVETDDELYLIKKDTKTVYIDKVINKEGESEWGLGFLGGVIFMLFTILVVAAAISD